MTILYLGALAAIAVSLSSLSRPNQMIQGIFGALSFWPANGKLLASVQARRSSIARGAILAEIHVHLHANREWTGLAQADQHLHHVDVSHIALAERIIASSLHQRRNERDRSRDFAIAKRGGTHQHRLSRFYFFNVTFVPLATHAQCRNVAEQNERLRRRWRRQFPWFGIHLQDGAINRRTNRHLFNGGLGCQQFAARDVELAFGLRWQRRVSLDPAKLSFLLDQTHLRTRQTRTGRLHICFRTSAGPPFDGRLVGERPRLGYSDFSIGHRILGPAPRRRPGQGGLF